MDDTENVSMGNVAIRPGYIESLTNAARQFETFWPSLLIVAAVVLMATTLLSLIQVSLEDWQYIVFSLPLSAASLVLSSGYVLATLKAARGEKPSVRDLSRPFTQILTVVFSSMLAVLIIGFGFLLLVIPGIIFLCRLAFVPHLVVDRRIGVLEAIKGSWNMTKGHFRRIFLLELTNAAVGLAVMGILLLVLPFGPGASGLVDSLANPTTNLTIELVLGVLFMPVGAYVMLVWGSLYHAIRLEKAVVS